VPTSCKKLVTLHTGNVPTSCKNPADAVNNLHY
jgi:hypothetical protein